MKFLDIWFKIDKMLSRLVGLLRVAPLDGIGQRGVSRRERNARGLGTKLVKGFVFAEIVVFFGSYYVWRRMNHSQEFRYYMRNNYPSILEGDFMRASLFLNQFLFIDFDLMYFSKKKGFYQIGEQISNLNTRSFDSECWKRQEDKTREE